MTLADKILEHFVAVADGDRLEEHEATRLVRLARLFLRDPAAVPAVLDRVIAERETYLAKCAALERVDELDAVLLQHASAIDEALHVEHCQAGDVGASDPEPEATATGGVDDV